MSYEKISKKQWLMSGNEAKQTLPEIKTSTSTDTPPPTLSEKEALRLAKKNWGGEKRKEKEA